MTNARLAPAMRLARRSVLALTLVGATACENFLDVNDNPNGPQFVSANLYLAPMLHWMVTGPQFDGRFVGQYTQQWVNATATLTTWSRMGYDAGSDNAAQQWRDVYWSFGQNLVDMMNLSEAEERWDLLGVGHILKAWGWQNLVDLHGPIIISEAFDQSTFDFSYDTEEFAYQEVRRLIDSAIVLLNRTDGAVDATYLGRTDKIYNGDRVKWLRFAHGLKAIHLNHFSNKATYDPDAVIAEVNASFIGNADDALLTYPGTGNDDRNFWGRTRGNLAGSATVVYRQSDFAVNLMNGTHTGGVVDPRMSRMLSPAPDGQYRGLSINQVGGFGALPAAQQPNNLHGYVGTGGLQLPGRYLFDDRARIPAMTYAQLQFVKAEAAYRDGDLATARTAYTAGIGAHIDFVNARNLDNGQTPTQISAAERTAYLTNVNIVPATDAGMTMTRIMTQKYIAQYGWGHNELWMDMRRFHYTDIDPASGVQVFPGFVQPTVLFADNNGDRVQRIRPRFNSEYVWNTEGLSAIQPVSGLATHYHTVPLWITLP